MEKKGSYFIFLIIIAVQTLIVAALAVFVLMVGMRPAVATEAEGDPTGAYADELDPTAAGADNVTIALPPPDEADLTSIALFAEDSAFNLKDSVGQDRESMILLGVTIKYFHEIDGIADVTAKINLNMANLQEIVGVYFQNKTLEDVRMADTRIAARNEIKSQMNEYLLGTISEERDRRKVTAIVYDVAFSGWTYQ